MKSWIKNSYDSPEQEISVKELKSKYLKMYDLIWFVNKVAKEVIERNKSYAFLANRKKILSNSTHTMGKLKIVETGTHKY